jgi:hypothetical protein
MGFIQIVIFLRSNLFVNYGNTICRVVARHRERTHAALYVVDIHNPRQDTSMFMIQSPLASTKFT